MNRILKTELYKLKRNRSYWAILLLTVVSFVGLSYFDNEVVTVKEAFSSSATMVPLLGAIAVIGIAHLDYNEGTLKNTVTCGISRMNIYIGKLIAAFIGAMGVFLIEAILSVGYAIINGSPISIDVFFIIKSFALQALIVLNYTVIYFMIGTLIKSSALAISISFAIYLFGTFVFGYVSHFLHLSGLMNYDLGTLSVAIESVTIQNVTIVHLLVTTVVVVCISFIGGILFSKQDIK